MLLAIYDYDRLIWNRARGGPAPGSPPIYHVMTHLLIDSVEAFQGAFGPHAKDIMADVPNYTDITPVIQISEVKISGVGL